MKPVLMFLIVLSGIAVAGMTLFFILSLKPEKKDGVKKKKGRKTQKPRPNEGKD